MHKKVWAHPGVETPEQPDEPDNSAPGHALQGLGVDWRRVVGLVGGFGLVAGNHLT
jgi:hypothetical protein